MELFSLQKQMLVNMFMLTLDHESRNQLVSYEQHMCHSRNSNGVLYQFFTHAITDVIQSFVFTFQINMVNVVQN